MLARNNLGVEAAPFEETTICSWTADGTKYLVGFNAHGSGPAEFRLYVGTDPDPWYSDQIKSTKPSAYVADRASKIPAGEVITLKVYHESPLGSEVFKGTILGS